MLMTSAAAHFSYMLIRVKKTHKEKIGQDGGEGEERRVSKICDKIIVPLLIVLLYRKTV